MRAWLRLSFWDATWGVDAGVKIRGMWKRHRNVDNYWVIWEHIQLDRWHSRTLALQTKAVFEDILQPAYRTTQEAWSA